METNKLSLALRSLKEANIAPDNIEHSEVGDFHMINYWNSLNSKIICESVQCGMSKSLNTAIAKCTSEYVERLASTENWKRHLGITPVVRTDGYACLPKDFYGQNQSIQKVRENAFFEATERFVWAKWWDNHDIGFSHTRVRFSDLGFSKTEDLLNSFLNIKSLHLIKPFISNSENEVAIFLLEMSHGGYLSGGACGTKNSISTSERALAELVRHCLAYKKLLNNGLKADSFYSERLCFFATGRGKDFVVDRLESQGAESITLPNLVVDELVPHSLSESFYVYRCLFEKQPVFIGGALERLCL